MLSLSEKRKRLEKLNVQNMEMRLEQHKHMKLLYLLRIFWGLAENIFVQEIRSLDNDKNILSIFWQQNAMKCIAFFVLYWFLGMYFFYFFSDFFRE